MVNIKTDGLNSFQDLFIQAINNTKLIKISFDYKEKGIISATAIPFDIGASSRYKDEKIRYYFYIIDPKNEKPNIAILPEQLLEIEMLEKPFNPEEYITWKKISWITKRDWGKYS
ncbi:MAG TPA: hypothetical protein VNX68_09030 [Nitrosopumilaceae archaeon]|jgi:hypothetical protein|nr:hypothetical protein [Nitrosopumilaceae archaeon]